MTGERGCPVFYPSSVKLLFDEHSHKTQISSHFFAHLEKSIHISLPQISLQLIFQSRSLQVPDHPAKPLAIAYDWYIIVHLAISCSKQNEKPDLLLKVLPTGKISLHHSP